MPFSNLDSGSFAPEALAVIYEAFDLAWAEIGGQFGDDSVHLSFVRNNLAQAVLTAAEAQATDPGQLKAAALEAFALSERLRR